jgi:hypothetical protein
LSTTLVPAIAGRMADGVLAAALAFDGVSVAAAIVTAAAARLRNNLRIYVPLHVMSPAWSTVRCRSNRLDV